MSMFICLMLFLSSQMAQEAAPVAEPRTIWEIKLKGKEELIYGYVQDKSEFKKPRVRVELDMPESRQGFIVLKGSEIEEYNKELPILRDQRIKRDAEKAGRELINGKSYQRAEVEWADRARQMAGIVAQETPPAPPEESPSTPPEPATPTPREAPGVWVLWGPHALAGAAGLVLLAAVARFFFTGA